MQRLTWCFILFMLGWVTAVPSRVTFARFMSSETLQSSANDLIAAVNALRIANGLPAYIMNPILMQIAQDQAAYMAATGQVAHRPGLTGRILDAGYPLAGDLSAGGFRAENITGGNKTAAQAVQEWTGDALHSNTMLSANLTEIGAGVATVGGRSYMVIDCARPTPSGQPQAYTPATGGAESESFSSSDFILPITISTPDENGLVYHDVQQGQSLWAIAIEYGVKIDEIRALNNLGDTLEIYQGDRLLVRRDQPQILATATFLASTKLPTETLQFATSTSMPTSSLLPNKVSTTPFENREGASPAGIVIGVVLATLLIAGLLTWIISRRTV